MRLRGAIGRLLAASILITISAGGAAFAAQGQVTQKREVRAIDRIIVTEPLPEIPESNRRDIAVAPSAMAWRPSVLHSGSEAGTSALTLSEPTRGLVVWLMLTCLIAAGGWFGWSQQTIVVSRLRSGLNSVPWALDVSRSLRARLATVGALIRSSMPSPRSQPIGGATYSADAIESRLARVVAIVAAVPRAAPLREVLDDELRRVRQRLAAAQGGGDAASGRLTAPAFRVIQRDLERIERIAVSAQRSIGGSDAGSAIAMPASAREAYEALGINSNVTEATLKKILDALRMSWHPDLASDDADRLVREARIKQINIASELIAAERRAA